MTSESRLELLIADGLAASQEGRTAVALTLFAEAAAAAPDSGMPHFLMGSEHAGAGNVAAAEAAFAQAVLLAPDFTLARYQLGLLQFCTGRAPVALVTWQPLRELPEGDALGHFARGFLELAHDRFDATLGHFLAGLQCPDANPAVCADIQKLVHEVGRLSAAARARAEAPTGDAADRAMNAIGHPGTGANVASHVLTGGSKTLH